MDPKGEACDERDRSLAAYTRDLNALRQKLKIAEEQSARGESRPLDIEQFKQELRSRLAEVGIA